jgi:hypothetical protein
VVAIRDFTPTTLNECAVKFQGVLGSGAFRMVYKFGRDKVAKFQRQGMIEDSANNTEWRVWNELKDTEAGKYLCPILCRAGDGTLIVMPKMTVVEEFEDRLLQRHCRVKTDEQERQVWKEIDALNERVRQFAWQVRQACEVYGWRADDLHERNIAEDRDGNLRVIDYGNFYKIAEGSRW